MSVPAAAFGEMALVDKSGRSATATAETDCAWLLIGRNEFLAMVKTRPAFGIALMRSLSARVLHIGKLLGG
jgi:CRP/FNR family cyclic AMP-dependent transcriptional regulator